MIDVARAQRRGGLVSSNRTVPVGDGPYEGRHPMISSDTLQTRFLLLLPRIKTCAQFLFRDIKCPDKKADRIAEVIALAWKWFVELERRGKDPASFITALATLACRAVRSGRRLATMEPAKDVFTSRTQVREGFTVTTLPDPIYLQGNGFDDTLRDNTQTPPPDAAAFRIDFPRWLGTLSARTGRLVGQLMSGEKTSVAARAFGVSPGRVSQLRQELHDDWLRFHGETTHNAV